MRCTRRRTTPGKRWPTRFVPAWGSTFPIGFSGRAKARAMPMRSNAGREALRGLYAITPEARDSAWLAARVAECIDGGASLVQYRAKEAAPGLALEQAGLLAQLCRARRVPLIVNDSVELAIAAGAQGVHLGRDDPDVRGARAAFRDAIIGVSCYDDPSLAGKAVAAGADYVAIGSVLASPTQPGR